MKTSLKSWLAVAFTTLVVGCVVSPQPSPPGSDPSLDGDGIGTVELTETLDQSNLLSFEAAPGTVDPAEGVVVVTNLANSDAPSLAAVAADGSFTIALAGFPGDTVRFQVKSGAKRSQPFDIVVGADRVTLTEPAPLPGCLTIDPARWVALDGEGDARNVLVSNECAFSVQIGAPSLRRGKAGFSFSPTQPVSLNPGQTAFLTVRADVVTDEPEDVLFLDLAGPDVPRQAITISND